MDEIIKWLEDNNFDISVIETVKEEDWSKTDAITLCDGRDVVVASEKPMSDEIAVHEFSHSAFKLLDIVGISPVLAEEAYAYLVEFLYRKWKELNCPSCDVQSQ